MTFEITILGCGAALPTLRHHPTGQVVNVHDKFFLVDCGEGTQMQLRRYRIKLQRIHHVFISHLHGDHYYGLNGLLSTMHLLGRSKALHVYADKGLEKLHRLQLEVGEMHLNFDVIFHDNRCDQPRILYEDNTLEVWGIPLEHRISTTGFIFREKPRKANINRAAIAEHNLTVREILALKNGNDVSRIDGTLLKAEALTVPAPNGRSYAFCSDTRYSEKVIEAVSNVDVLYHEATFADNLRDRAAQTYHSTAAQAAEVALRAGAKQLLLGHFSARYLDESILLNEAKAVFEQTQLADEGMRIQIPRL